MSGIEAKEPFREVTIEAVVTRADGTIEDLGIIAEWHKNPIIRTARRVRKHIRKKRS